MFYNYKHFYSIVLQAVADAHGKFIVIDVGGYGNQNDGGTFRSSSVFSLMQEGKLNTSIPQDASLAQTSVVLPFVLIGDEAYPLLRHLLDAEKEYFNKRLSRAR